MRKRIALLPVVALVACMTIAFLWSSSKLDRSVAEVNQQYEQARVALTKLQTEQSSLKATLDSADSDAFVENQARTLYGYMKPDEIRFVITNPEALYGTEGTAE